MIVRKKRGLYGVMAEFDTPEELMAAAHRTYQEGYRRMDAFSPMPIEGLAEAIGHHHTRLPLIVLIGGILGGLGGFSLCYYTSVVAFPINVGGRPFNSWPAFVPVTFETTILAAALTAVLAMLALNGLPTPYHPVFNAPRFALATRNRFFLLVEARDAKFDRQHTPEFLRGLGAQQVVEVEP